MSRPPQDDAINAAITDLAWCQDRDIDNIASLAAKRFQPTRWHHGISTDAMADALRAATYDQGGSSRDIAWSDPTGETAIHGTRGDGDSGDDPTPPAIDSALELVYWSTDELMMLCLANERIDLTVQDRAGKLRAAIDTLRRLQPLVIQARDQQDRLGRDHIDLLVYQSIQETAEWLRAKGEVLVHGSKRAAQPAPQPGDRPAGCVSCARDRDHQGRPYWQPIDEVHHSARQMCRRCGDYASGQGKWPPLKAVEYLHRTGKNWTQKILWDAEREEATA